MADKPKKPKKPYEGFPLTAHSNGHWCKKILGKIHYFGKWGDWQAALDSYNQKRDFLHAGNAPPVTATVVGDVLNGFLGFKDVAKNEGDITKRSYKEYETLCDTIAACLRPHRPIEAIGNGDLHKLRQVLGTGKNGQQLSPVTLKKSLSIARMVFSYANEELGTSIRYKKALSSPKARVIRQKQNETGERLYTTEEIRLLVDSASLQMKAMILLGINCGFGNEDCGTLDCQHLDLEGGFHNYWRPKTQVARRCPLWQETIDAIKAVKRDQGVVFQTKYGNPWWVEEMQDAISAEFRKLATKVGIYRKNITTFYTLRRTFRTIARRAGVEKAVVDSIMGHVPDTNDMAAVYVQRVFDDELVKCTNYVRSWYLGEISIA